MKRKIWTAVLAGCLLFTAGCAEQENEIPETILVQEGEEDAYPVTTVEYGEVVKSATVSCTYTSTDEEKLSFAVEGRPVERVNVEEGDYVTKGQLLAALDVQDLEEQIEEQQYGIESLELKKRQTQELLEFDLASADTLFTYTRQSRQDKKELQEKKEDINRQYRTTLEDLEDSIALENARLRESQETLAGGRLYAGISGQVTYCKSALADSYSRKDETVLIISDRDKSYFIAQDVSLADYFAEGTPVELTYWQSTGQVTCEVLPVLTDQWEEQMYFKPTGEEILPDGLSGNIQMELERKENVLCLPADAVHESDNGPFVYLAGDGLLEMRYVTVGLEGDAFVEITDGLEQGDIVAAQR